MGSADVQRFADRDDANALHVAWSARDRLWWAVGKEGSYGGAAHRDEAIRIAKDASATGFTATGALSFTRVAVRFRA